MMESTLVQQSDPVSIVPAQTETVSLTQTTAKPYPPIIEAETPSSSVSLSPTLSPVTKPPTVEETPRATPGPEDWKDLPVVPEISDKVTEIFKNGLSLGNNPHSFFQDRRLRINASMVFGRL